MMHVTYVSYVCFPVCFPGLSSGLLKDALCLIDMGRALLGSYDFTFSTVMLCINLIMLVVREVWHFSALPNNLVQ